MALRPRHRPAAAVLLLVVTACSQDEGGPAATDCRSIALYDERGARVSGVEDLAVDHARGLVYLSAHDRRAVARERDTEAGPLTTGGLFIMSVSPDLRPGGDVARLPLPGAEALRPHGIALGDAREGHRHLHVIDRRYERRNGHWTLVPQHLVIGLDRTGLRARHAETTAMPEALCSPNDLATAEGAVYVTNDHGACGGAGRVLEDVLALSAAFVMRLADGAAARIAGDLAFANGIAVNAGEHMLTVAETRAEAMTRIDLKDGGKRQRIALPGAPDNITRAADGGLIVALHPDLLRFAAFRAGWPGAEHAPSRVVRLRTGDGQKTEVERLFDDPDGRLVSGATVAAEIAGWLLVAGGYGDRMAVCRLPEDRA